MDGTSQITPKRFSFFNEYNIIKKKRIQARIQEKNKHPQNFPVSRFYPMFPRFSQRFPDFSLTKFFKVRKCERCGSLNPRLI